MKKQGEGMVRGTQHPRGKRAHLAQREFKVAFNEGDNKHRAQVGAEGLEGECFSRHTRILPGYGCSK